MGDDATRVGRELHDRVDRDGHRGLQKEQKHGEQHDPARHPEDRGHDGRREARSAQDEDGRRVQVQESLSFLGGCVGRSISVREWAREELGEAAISIRGHRPH